MYKVRQVYAGETLIFAGDLSPSIYLVKSGKFKVIKRIPDADRFLGMIHPGEFIGEMAFLLNSESHASDVTASEDSEVIEIPKNNFYEVLAANPIWLKALLKSLVTRIDLLNKKI